MNGKPFEGEGTKTYANGLKFTGKFRSGILSEGTLIHPNGDKYVGSFDLAKYHGIGTLYYADGRVKEGAWSKGEYYSTSAQYKIEQVIWAEKWKTIKSIYNACLLDKSSDVDMQTTSLKNAVEDTCHLISIDPSWFESFKYN